MIDFQTTLLIHNILIEKFGGVKGIRDQGGLEAAIARPNATFDGLDLYPEAIDKAAAIFESIIINHPFLDGNKRTAYALLRLTLLDFELDIYATEDEKYDMTISASKGELNFDGIKLWLAEKVKQIN
ncbi:type II toxin-antitoxin system death-on-curing family toxin [Mucilaginibacter sp. HC2]|uniref:type II toxin-antitoxin system death-on-curing family toxin n=1 Tax=Mucilaginibacter inviolabilis TaxID=2714892 RepID=UPI00140D927D|nr:type II toxin-antitoxin system death-on-curing family toxin [Mucilaginibacter inviolabilis]NHA07109.1 type II toxin-antitoxin system death-on-curing family toxin [Mucilaginibacter inviolabilis]